MNRDLSPSAQKIQDYLENHGYFYKVLEFQETTRTSADAAKRVGCEVGQIVKSLVFKGINTHIAVLVLTSGANRVDTEKLEKIVGEPFGRADPDFVRIVTGFSIGGIPPIGHVTKIDTFIDEDLQNYETVWAAAGSPNAVFELTFNDLLTMTSAKIYKIKE